MLSALFFFSKDRVPLFSYIVDTKAPPLAYFLSVLPEFESLDPWHLIDKRWVVVSTVVDGLYVLALAPTVPDSVETFSEDEEEDEEEEESESASAESENESEYGERQKENSDKVEDGHSKEQTDKSKSTICTVPNPLNYYRFLEVFIEATKMMLDTETLTRQKIIVNSHRILMLLQEMTDANISFVVDLNQLRELLPSDSILNTIISTTKHIQNSATTSIATFKHGGISALGSSMAAANAPDESTFKGIILEKSGNPTPWRKTQVKEPKHEIFVDVYECMNLIISSTKPSQSSQSYYPPDCYSKALIKGQIDLRTSIAGSPILQIDLQSPLYNSLSLFGNETILDQDTLSKLHVSVDRNVWRNSIKSTYRVLQCTPPDGKSTLLNYSIDLKELSVISKEDSTYSFPLQKFCGPIAVKFHTGLLNPISHQPNEFEISVTTFIGDSIIKEVNDLQIEIHHRNPANYTLRVVRSSTGTISKESYGWKWSFESVALGSSYTLRGSIQLGSSTGNNLEQSMQLNKANSNGLINGMPAYGASTSLSTTSASIKEENNDNTSAAFNENENLQFEPPSYLNVLYSQTGAVFTDTRVKKIDVESTKIFKGVKYRGKSSCVIR